MAGCSAGSMGAVGLFGSYLDSDDLGDGYGGGVKLEVGLRRVAIFAEARWLFLEADVDSALDELQDIDEADVDGFGINVGLLFRF